MNQISLIGPNGEEVIFTFNGHKNPVSFEKFDSQKSPKEVFDELRANGYKAMGEEEDWLITGKWPE